MLKIFPSIILISFFKEFWLVPQLLMQIIQSLCLPRNVQFDNFVLSFNFFFSKVPKNSILSNYITDKNPNHCILKWQLIALVNATSSSMLPSLQSLLVCYLPFSHSPFFYFVLRINDNIYWDKIYLLPSLSVAKVVKVTCHQPPFVTLTVITDN